LKQVYHTTVRTYPTLNVVATGSTYSRHTEIM